jgi:hypothetical protein
LDGYIYKIETSDGRIEEKKKITSCERGLWTTPTIDKNGDILLSTKDTANSGRVIKLNHSLDIIWEYKTNKILSVPVINRFGDVLFGSWDGYYNSLRTMR